MGTSAVLVAPYQGPLQPLHTLLSAGVLPGCRRLIGTGFCPLFITWFILETGRGFERCSCEMVNNCPKRNRGLGTGAGGTS